MGYPSLTFIINEYKTWLSIETIGISKTARDIVLPKLVYQKQLEISFFQNVAKTTKRSFSLLYSIRHQVQGDLHLDKNIVRWKESLITTQCVLFCPCVGVFVILKDKKVWLLFHCKSSIVILSIYICTLFKIKIEKNKKEIRDNKKNNNLILSKMILVGLELTTTGSTGQCANHCATKD